MYKVAQVTQFPQAYSRANCKTGFSLYNCRLSSYGKCVD